MTARAARPGQDLCRSRRCLRVDADKDRRGTPPQRTTAAAVARRPASAAAACSAPGHRRYRRVVDDQVRVLQHVDSVTRMNSIVLCGIR